MANFVTKRTSKTVAGDENIAEDEYGRLEYGSLNMLILLLLQLLLLI